MFYIRYITPSQTLMKTDSLKKLADERKTYTYENGMSWSVNVFWASLHVNSLLSVKQILKEII